MGVWLRGTGESDGEPLSRLEFVSLRPLETKADDVLDPGDLTDQPAGECLCLFSDGCLLWLHGRDRSLSVTTSKVPGPPRMQAGCFIGPKP